MEQNIINKINEWSKLATEDLDLINEYQKRITKYHKINIVELEDETNKQAEELIINKESKRI